MKPKRREADDLARVAFLVSPPLALAIWIAPFHADLYGDSLFCAPCRISPVFTQPFGLLLTPFLAIPHQQLADVGT